MGGAISVLYGLSYWVNIDKVRFHRWLQVLMMLTGDCEVEFGTVLVFTCAANCWTSVDDWREEIVIVQYEPNVRFSY